ncbi:MAG TPA: hemerythrin domain-containing protein [Bacillota bacterium]|jgi:iron-sulfur cluster repair protein YtfE (RIC family)
MPEIIGKFREDHERALDHLGDLTHYVAWLREGRPMGQLIDGFKSFSDFLDEALNEHFRQEEEALFPSLRPIFGHKGGPVEQMLREHEVIEEAHAQMVRELAREAPRPLRPGGGGPEDPRRPSGPHREGGQRPLPLRRAPPDS